MLQAARSSLEACQPASTSAELFEQIRGLEELKAVAAARQAEVTAAFVAVRRAEQRAAGVRSRHVGRGIAREIGLAKRESHSRAARYAGFTAILATELPATFAALSAGQTSEWRAMLVARETGWLSIEDRLGVDAALGPRLHALGDRSVEAEAARLAYVADPHGKMEQIRRATGDRRVSLAPAPDAMSRLYATLPLAQGVTAYAALMRAADAARAAGDQRSRGQVMADTLVERITGQTRADAVPVTVDVIVTDQALFNTGPDPDEPATVNGHGSVPAAWVRDLVTRRAADDQAAGPAGQDGVVVKIRRLFTDPAGRLVTMETASRAFTPAMAEFIRLRDQRCATPWCGAPIRHIDHVVDWADGGATSLTNGEGLCEACNYAKQAPGWASIPQSDGSHERLTPTGHRLDALTAARAPDPPAPDLGTTPRLLHVHLNYGHGPQPPTAWARGRSFARPRLARTSRPVRRRVPIGAALHSAAHPRVRKPAVPTGVDDGRPGRR